MSSSEGDEDSIPNTQKMTQQLSDDSGFERQLQGQDNAFKAQIVSEEGKSVEIYMTQDEQERLPMPSVSQPKRKKENSKDPTRLSVAMAKPSKSIKKGSALLSKASL